MSSIEDFNKLECELIPAAMVNAYVLPKLNPLDQAELIIESSWGEEGVDLTPAVKKAETVTHMKLSPENAPLYLEYDNEANEHECIYGDDLAQIIPVMKLKDVDDTNEPVAGDALVFDGNIGKFVTYPLIPTIEDLDERVTANRTDINALQISVASLQDAVQQLIARVLELERRLTPPSGVPTNQVVFGNINSYGDPSNNNDKTHGLYSHSPNTNTYGDQYFS